jgi:hypothetical protein
MSRLCFVAVGRICMINIFSDTQITENEHNMFNENEIYYVEAPSSVLFVEK